VTVQHLHRAKYPCAYGTDSCNPVCLGIKGVTSDVLTRAFLFFPANHEKLRAEQYNTSKSSEINLGIVGAT
jgi:hypothetical protein